MFQKIVKEHGGDPFVQADEPLGLVVDQALLQDNTGTLALLEFEAIGIDRIRIPLAVAYLDHNIYQFNHRNSEDHQFIQSASRRFGIHLSRLGNGICHQVHRELFGVPRKVLLGSDSHSTNVGGLGMLGLGAGGLDVAVAMAGAPYWLKMPHLVGVRLKGQLSPWVTAKDLVLTLVGMITSKGGTGKLYEFIGDGVRSLDVEQRCTVANMSAETGATSFIFPSDETTLNYFKHSGREHVWAPLEPDADVEYEEILELDLSALEPVVSCPSMPDRIRPISEVEGTKVHQVIIGSCTNGAYDDVAVAAKMLKGRSVHPDVDMIVAPSSRNVALRLASAGLDVDILGSGANLTMSTCGACIGAGHVPAPGTVSLRTFNRNFKGRSGLENDAVFLCSPEVATMAAITGEITDPRKFGAYPLTDRGQTTVPWSGGIQTPPERPQEVSIQKGDNIAPLPTMTPLPDDLEAPVLICVGDNVSTDHIVPSSTETTIFRSNIPRLAQHTLSRIDPQFASRAAEAKGGVIVAGDNYGAGSSREHAALCPLYLGIRLVVAKSFARIHRANLINFGILPLVLQDPADFERIKAGTLWRVRSLPQQVRSGQRVRVVAGPDVFEFMHDLSPREVDVVLAGGLLPYAKTS